MKLYSLLILTMFATAAGADQPERTVEDVEKAVKAKLAKIKSLKASVLMETELMFDEYRHQGFNDGSFEYIIKDGKTVFRKELTTYEVSEAEERRNELHGSHLTVCDGTFCFGVREVNGKETAYKMKQLEQYGTDPFMELRTNGDITVRPDDKIGEHDCYVVRTTPTDAHGDTTISGFVDYFFDKKMGVMRKYVAHGPDNQIMRVATFSEFEVNKPIDPKRFKFVKPIGVSVVDLTKAQDK